MHPLLDRFSRSQRLWFLVAMDAVLLPLALLTAITLRFGTWPHDLYKYWLLLPVAPLVAIPVFIKLGLYRAVVRYMDEKVMVTVFSGVSLSVLLLTAVVTMGRFVNMPRSAIIIYWIIAMTYIGASRYLARGFLRTLENQKLDRIAVAIYGAGRAGSQLALALEADRHYQVAAFFDDDRTLHGRIIGGVRVFPPEEAADRIRSLGIAQVLLAIPSLAKARKREILNTFEPLHVQLKTVPDMKNLVEGTIQLADVREVTIEELLGRDVVEPISDLLHANITGKAVMVTGAGGSIGSELCRQILTLQPTHLVLFEISEFALYQIERELRERLTQIGAPITLTALLGSVVDRARVEQVCRQHAIQTIYHAAAYKHVPIVEDNPFEGMRNNMFGTYHAAHAAINAGVETFVLISTDKAVRPTNIMGASKRMAELVLQALAQAHTQPVFSMVRFGNVLGSSGSVVPLFREQIKQGGPITLTHQDITRYFMTIPEAAQLVIQAGAMAKGGEVFLLDMGEPIRIYDLARKMVHLSGLEVRDQTNPEGDIAITLTGLRPGEKLYEELLIADQASPSPHPLIMLGNEVSHPPEVMQNWIVAFESALTDQDGAQLLQLLRDAKSGLNQETRPSSP